MNQMLIIVKIPYTLLFFLLATFIGFGGCTATAGSDDNVPDIIESNWQRFADAWESEDAAACAAFYRENALHVPDSLPVNRGRNSIESFYSMLFDVNRSSRYSHQTESITFSDHLAVEYATFTVEWVDNEGEQWTYRSRALIHWQKNDAGNWLIQNFFYNQPESLNQ